MARTVDDLCDILAAPKRLVALGSWTPQDRQLRIKATLEADETIISGISLMIAVAKERPDEKVAIMLQVEVRRKPRAFARVDWRASQHLNSHRWCGEHRLTDAGRTHFHSPILHRHVDYEELFAGKTDLPVATSVHPEPENFTELLEISAELLHIENILTVPVPPWSPQASFH